MQTLLDDAAEVVVVGKRAALDGGELELALREVARRRAKPERRRAFAVALVAVTRAAVVRVRFVPASSVSAETCLPPSVFDFVKTGSSSQATSAEARRNETAHEPSQESAGHARGEIIGPVGSIPAPW